MVEDEKKARIISLFKEIKRARAEAQRGKRRKNGGTDCGGGTTIIGSTIVVCGDDAQALVAELLAQKRRPNRAG